MKVIGKTSDNNIANVFIAQNNEGKLIEFVESVQPPLSIKEKWVLIISTLYGCPVRCTFCDAGSSYHGILNYEEMKYQIDYLVNFRFGKGKIDTDRFKIQFARMGEPAFNKDVLKLLVNIPKIYDYNSFTPSLSTIAPESCNDFFDELLKIKKNLYDTDFQLQFSIHSIDNNQRNQMMPVKKWSFEKISDYSEKFYSSNGKKITLNFILTNETIFDYDTLTKYFHPDLFILKISPLNPTYKASKSGLKSAITRDSSPEDLIMELRKKSYDVILNIGEWEENKIGSNCGQFINSINKDNLLNDAYTYKLLDLR